MTEEDTFNALKREPFQVVRDTVRMMNAMGISKKIIARVVRRAGWEPRDYMNQLAKELNK